MKRFIKVWMLCIIACIVAFFIRYPGTQRYGIQLTDQGVYALDRVNGRLVVVGTVGGMIRRPPQPEIDNSPWMVDYQYWLKRGPWPGGIEFYERRGKYLRITPSYRVNTASHPLPDMREVEAAMQNYYDQTSGYDLSSALKPTTTRLPKQARASVIRLCTYFAASLVLASLIEVASRVAVRIRTWKQRRRAGMCVHCGYDCHDLLGPNCPECGQPHESEAAHEHSLTS